MNNTSNKIQAELDVLIKKSEDAGYPVKQACSLVCINPGGIDAVEIGFMVNPVIDDLKGKMDVKHILVIAMDDGNVMMVEEPMDKSKPYNEIATMGIKDYSPSGVLGIKVHGKAMCMDADAYRNMFSTDMDMIEWLAEAKATEVIERCERTGEDITEVSMEVLAKLIDGRQS